MATWQRVESHRECGRCGAALERGDVALVLRLVQVQAAKYRCASCADEPAPDLPPLPPPPDNTITPRLKASHRAPLFATDYKRAQAKDEE